MFFDGSSKARTVRGSGRRGKGASDRQALLQKARKERAQRAEGRKEHASATVMQRVWRGGKERTALRQRLDVQLQTELNAVGTSNAEGVEGLVSLLSRALCVVAPTLLRRPRGAAGESNTAAEVRFGAVLTRVAESLSVQQAEGNILRQAAEQLTREHEAQKEAHVDGAPPPLSDTRFLSFLLGKAVRLWLIGCVGRPGLLTQGQQVTAALQHAIEESDAASSQQTIVGALARDVLQRSLVPAAAFSALSRTQVLVRVCLDLQECHAPAVPMIREAFSVLRLALLHSAAASSQTDEGGGGCGCGVIERHLWNAVSTTLLTVPRLLERTALVDLLTEVLSANGGRGWSQVVDCLTGPQGAPSTILDEGGRPQTLAGATAAFNVVTNLVVLPHSPFAIGSSSSDAPARVGQGLADPSDWRGQRVQVTVRFLPLLLQAVQSGLFRDMTVVENALAKRNRSVPDDSDSRRKRQRPNDATGVSSEPPSSSAQSVLAFRQQQQHADLFGTSCDRTTAFAQTTTTAVNVVCSDTVGVKAGEKEQTQDNDFGGSGESKQGGEPGTAIREEPDRSSELGSKDDDLGDESEDADDFDELIHEMSSTGGVRRLECMAHVAVVQQRRRLRRCGTEKRGRTAHHSLNTIDPAQLALVERVTSATFVQETWRAVTSGGRPSEASPTGSTSFAPSPQVLLDWCSMYAALLMSTSPLATTSAGQTSSSAPLLNTLAFGTPGTPVISFLFQTLERVFGEGLPALVTGKLHHGHVDSSLLDGMAEPSDSWRARTQVQLESAFFLLCTVYSHLLLASDDEEMFERQVPFDLQTLARLVRLLNGYLRRIYWTEHWLAAPSTVARLGSSHGTVHGAGMEADAMPPPLPSPTDASSASSSSSSLSSSSSAGASAAVIAAGATAGGAATGGSGLSRGAQVVPALLGPTVNSSVLQAQAGLAATRLFNQLYERHLRRPFTAPEDWLWPRMRPEDVSLDYASMDEFMMMVGGGGMEQDAFSFQNPLLKDVLASLPQVVPFEQRVEIFEGLLDTVRVPSHGARVRVRRDRLYEDSFDQLNPLGPALKGHLQIEFVSEHGYTEAGIDGGGLMKEFMDALTKAAFSPEYGLFAVTERDQLLVPNPQARTAAGSRYLEEFEFLGRILGKAVHERILVEPQFALPFLNILLGRLNHIDELNVLDPELYHNLMSLKQLSMQVRHSTRQRKLGAASGGAPGQGGHQQLQQQQAGNAASDDPIADLDLNFTLSRASFGSLDVVELLPGGEHITVTVDNVFRYIHLFAHYKLNLETAQESAAFLRGFRDIIPVEWIRMFSPRELQSLIGGAARPLDLDDMRAHVTYRGYHPSQPYMEWFWDILGDLTPAEQSNFLRFTTSCSRQPLLGFRAMEPKVCIQEVPIYAEIPESADTRLEPRLPTAATCMNLLKLPRYESKEMLREKLLYAISAGAGFEMS